MNYSATIQGGLSLTPEKAAGTENAETLAKGAAVTIAGASNTVAQVLMDFEDYVEGSADPAVIQLLLSPKGGTFTAVAATDVITTSANHARAVYDEVRFTSTGTLPAGLTEDVSYWVLTTPGAATMTVSAIPGGAVVDITDTGTGVHSWQAYTPVEPGYEYPTEGPSTPVRILDRRDGRNNDFTKIKGLSLHILPTDSTLAASGKVRITCGDPAEPTRYQRACIALTAAADSNGIAFAVLCIPPGLDYDDDFPLRISIDAAENLSGILNLAGN